MSKLAHVRKSSVAGYVDLGIEGGLPLAAFASEELKNGCDGVAGPGVAPSWGDIVVFALDYDQRHDLDHQL